MGQSATGTNYSESALARYNQAINDYQKQIEQNAGKAGYQQSLEMAKQGAMTTANEAQRQATNAARASGLNKYQAAALGATKAADSANQNLLNQQNQVNTQLSNLLSGYNQLLGAQGQSANQAATVNQLQQQATQNANLANANNAQNAIQAAGTIASLAAMMSDERTKDAERINPDKADITKEMDKIDSFIFKYKKPVVEEMKGEKGVDDKAHVGVMAQELAENPVTASTVEEDENGYLNVDTGKLCMALTAVTSDMAKKLGEIEYELKMLKGAE